MKVKELLMGAANILVRAPEIRSHLVARGGEGLNGVVLKLLK